MTKGILKPKEDAFGQEMQSYYSGKDMCEIVERDDGYFSAYHSSNVYFSEYANWPDIEKEAMKLVKGRVLDVGCGVGRHALYLQEKGFDVTGIDVSPLALRIARLRGLKKAKLMSIRHLDFKPESFDTVILLGGNLGLIGTPEHGKEIFRKLLKIVSVDGIILGETRDPYKTDDPLHLEYHKRNIEGGRLGGQMKIRVRFQKNVSRWFAWLLLSKDEIKQLVNGTGWEVTGFLDSKDAGYVVILKKSSGKKR